LSHSHFLLVNTFLSISNFEKDIVGFLPTILNKVIPVAELVPLSAHDPFFIKYGFGFFIVTFLCILISYACISDIAQCVKIGITKTL